MSLVIATPSVGISLLEIIRLVIYNDAPADYRSDLEVLSPTRCNELATPLATLALFDDKRGVNGEGAPREKREVVRCFRICLPLASYAVATEFRTVEKKLRGGRGRRKRVEGSGGKRERKRQRQRGEPCARETKLLRIRSLGFAFLSRLSFAPNSLGEYNCPLLTVFSFSLLFFRLYGKVNSLPCH